MQSDQAFYRLLANFKFVSWYYPQIDNGQFQKWILYKSADSESNRVMQVKINF